MAGGRCARAALGALVVCLMGVTAASAQARKPKVTVIGTGGTIAGVSTTRTSFQTYRAGQLAIEAEFPVLESGAATPGAPGAVADEDALDTLVRNAAVLAGALELLPQGLATLGILPIQLKLVADIAAVHGHRVDGSHAKELLAAAGIGLGGQAVEGMMRRLLGRIARRFGGAAAQDSRRE